MRHAYSETASFQFHDDNDPATNSGSNNMQSLNAFMKRSSHALARIRILQEGYVMPTEGVSDQESKFHCYMVTARHHDYVVGTLAL
jgi:hypothetical protein